MKRKGCPVGKKFCKDTEVPMVGIVTKDGHVESYSYKKAKQQDFHHTFLMTEKALDSFDFDSTLRFLHYDKCTKFDKNMYTLEGDPALDPFGKGAKQMERFVSHVLKHGANPCMNVEIADHKMHTDYEGKIIGTLGELKKRFNL